MMKRHLKMLSFMLTYMVDGRKINDSKTVFKNGVDETSGTITYYLK